ncbi:hypothetical protein ACJX0J_033917, partial [Zea mays]
IFITTSLHVLVNCGQYIFLACLLKHYVEYVLVAFKFFFGMFVLMILTYVHMHQYFLKNNICILMIRIAWLAVESIDCPCESRLMSLNHAYNDWTLLHVLGNRTW